MLEGWYFITVALLVLSGGSKLRDPEPTRGALRVAGLPSSRWIVTSLAVGEIVIGAAALGLTSALAPATVALLYTAFAVFVIVAILRDLPLQSCGCFGSSDTPPGWLHVGVNLAAAGTAAMFAGRGGTDLFDLLAFQPAAGVPYISFLGIGAALLALILSDLPAVLTRTAG